MSTVTHNASSLSRVQAKVAELKMLVGARGGGEVKRAEVAIMNPNHMPVGVAEIKI